MVVALSVKEFDNEEHEAAHEIMSALAFRLNQANVLLIAASVAADSGQAKSQYRVVTAQVLSAINTLASILKLTQKLSAHIREAVAPTRVYHETCLVASFSAIDDGSRARRAELYSVYKSFRSQTMVRKAGGQILRVDRQPRLPRSHPDVKEALSLFGGTSRVRPCFEESRQEMEKAISEVDATAGLLFGGAEALVHDVSSEIIHGSYHGHCMFNDGSADEAKRLIVLASHFETIVFTVCMNTSALARATRHLLVSPAAMEEVSDLAMQLLLAYAPEDLAAQLKGRLFQG